MTHTPKQRIVAQLIDTCGCFATTDKTKPTFSRCPLHAAAPDLLAALEGIQSVTRDTLDTPRTSLTPYGALLAILSSASAAIKAAKGETQ